MILRSITWRYLGLSFLAALLECGVLGYLLLQGFHIPDRAFVLLVSENAEIQQAFLVGLIVAFGLNLLVFEYVAGWRIQRVAGEISKLVSRKPYVRITDNSPDEVGVITRFFNEMTSQIERLAHHLEKADEYTEEFTLAAKIQSDVVPKKCPPMPGLEIVGRTRPANQMGGDSFDFLQSEKQTVCYLGDATGHGVPAGLVMMMTNTLVRTFAEQYAELCPMLVETNRLLKMRIEPNMFMTLVALRWQHAEQKMSFAGCGHEYLLHYHAETGKCEAIKSGGIALGMVPDISKIIREQELDFREGDTIAIYSDGITEAVDSHGEQYGVERLRASMERAGMRATAESVFQNLTEDFVKFVGKYDNQLDDITLIVLKNRGKDFRQATVSLLVEGQDKTRPVDKWSW